jgi:hypothetical protein
LMLAFFATTTLAQEVNVEVDENQTVVVDAQQLEDASKTLDTESEKHEGKLKKSLKKISEGFKNMAKDLKANKDKPKKKLTLRSVLLKAGKGATFVSIQTARPFVNVSSFLKGFFERPSKNADEVEFMKLFLKHEDKFSDLWKNIDHIYNVDQATELFTQRVDSIIAEKNEVISKDLVEHFSTSGEEFSEENIVNFINNHEAYQELKPILGDITVDQIDHLEDIELMADPMKILGASRITIVEGVSAFALKTMIPKMIISIVSKSLGGTVLAVGLIADAGMITSTLMCTMNEKVVTQIVDGDEELKEFCQYVVNKSAYQLSVSRLKGYVAGKKFRRKFIKSTEKTKVKIQEKLKRDNRG